jgi:hypothetical protein
MTDKEIIQALRLCGKIDSNCRECKLWGDDRCVEHLAGAAADIIERLTAENAKAEAERDAAIADLKISAGCTSCKYHCSDITFCCDFNKKQNCKCMSCRLGLMNWEWRGLPETPEEE